MQDKTLTYVQLAEQTARQIASGKDDWRAFLDTASRLYKYDYEDQLMIHAQRPEATTCAAYEVWNQRMRRYVRRGSKGIALLDRTGNAPKLRYVFDVADTGTRRDSRTPVPWVLDETNERAVSDMLEKAYSASSLPGLPVQLYGIASSQAMDYWEAHQKDILGIVDGSFLEAYDVDTISVRFRNAVEVSSAYMMMRRCGLDAEALLPDEDFMPVLEFNTPQAIGVLGGAVSEISSDILRQIERTVRAAELERSNGHDRNELQDEQRYPDSRPDGSRNEAAGQVRQDAPGISEGASSGDLERAAGGGQAGQPSGGDRRGGKQSGRARDQRAGEAERRERGDEKARPDGLGAEHEQPESAGRGGRADGAGVQLNTDEGVQLSLFPSEAEQIEQIDLAESAAIAPFASSFSQADIDAERNYAGTPAGVPMPIARYGFPPPSAEVSVQTAPEWGYHAVKKAHPDDMVLVQVGDFFELYGEDARTAAPMLGLTLTSRPVPGAGRVDMCGIPAHQLEQYVEQLRDKYDVTISAVDRDSQERSVLSIPSIDHEAALAIDAYEAEFGADGRRVFGSSTIWQEEDFTEEEQDAWKDIDTPYIRKRLEEAGIVNGEVVDQEKLAQDPFIQMVEQTVARITQEEEQSHDITEATHSELSQPLPDLTEQTVSPTAAYQVGNTVYLEDGKPFIIERISPLGIELRDPSLVYPILRAESPESFARLMERYPQERKQPEVVSETTAVYPAEQNGLPYDIAVERMNIAPQTERTEQPAAQNFHITDTHLGEGGAKTKFGYNVAAIRTLKQIEAEGRAATPDEQEVLSRYVGWGGIPNAFDDSKADWKKEYEELKALLTPEEYEMARSSTLNAHYTSPIVIRAIYDAVRQMGFQSGNILEPSCGVGNFFGMLPDSMQSSRLYGVELDSISGRIARQLYPKAHIEIKGFEKTDRKDFFDLAVGNVPFGSYKVADKAFDRYGFLIHDYFFAKTLDQVRPGGVIAFITSKGTLDKQSPEVRRYIAERAELLGAIRLPNTAFKGNAGTEVTSDILFLQKRDRPIDIEPDWVHLGQTEEGIPINSYFADHPDMVLGRMAWDRSMYGNEKETTCEPIPEADLARQLAEAITHINGVYQEAELTDLGDGDAIGETIPADPNVKNYAYTVVDGQIYYRQNSVMIRPELNRSATERVKGLVELRDCVHRLMDAQLGDAEDSEIHALQAELNTLYDAFTAKCGLINARANRLAFADDSSYYLLCSLENLNDKGELESKADMFTRRTIKQRRSIEHADTAVEALTVSIGERAGVDLPYMEQLTGKTRQELIDDLKGVIFRVPMKEGGDGEGVYVTAHEYLSGNVREKLRIAQLAAKSDPALNINVEALQRAQPKDLEASEIDIRLGATWIGPEYIKAFAKELFNLPFYQERLFRIHYSPLTAEWRIEGKNSVSYSNVAINMTYGTDRVNGLRILEDSLNLRDVRVYDTVEEPDGSSKRVLNQKETTLAQQKQQDIKDAFRDWIWKDPQRRHDLVRKYNELFNSTRPREYDGSRIVFSGMNPEISLREHQRNAVAHVLYGGNTLLAHEVGGGKSATRS